MWYQAVVNMTDTYMMIYEAMHYMFILLDCEMDKLQLGYYYLWLSLGKMRNRNLSIWPVINEWTTKWESMHMWCGIVKLWFCYYGVVVFHSDTYIASLIWLPVIGKILDNFFCVFTVSGCGVCNDSHHNILKYN